MLILVLVTLPPLGLQLMHSIESRTYAGKSAPGICRVRTDARVIALTFDDGPTVGYSDAVLRLLHSARAQSTFFLIGRHAASLTSIVRREVASGMEIGNHSWSHKRLPDLGRAEFERELASTSETLLRLGADTRLFRAPFGLVTAKQLAWSRSMRLEPIHWSLAVDHYVGGLGLRPREAARQILDDLDPGEIVLAHDAGPPGDEVMDPRHNALATLELLLPELEKRGWQVTTVSSLLSRGTPIEAAPRPWFWQSGFSCPR